MTYEQARQVMAERLVAWREGRDYNTRQRDVADVILPELGVEISQRGYERIERGEEPLPRNWVDVFDALEIPVDDLISVVFGTQLPPHMRVVPKEEGPTPAPQLALIHDQLQALDAKLDLLIDRLTKPVKKS